MEGLSNFETVDVKADLVNRNLFIKMRVPDIRIRGFYKAEGKALVVTLKGDGPFTGLGTNAILLCGFLAIKGQSKIVRFCYKDTIKVCVRGHNQGLC